MKKLFTYVHFFTSLLLSFYSGAQDGGLDTTFNIGTSLGPNGRINAIAIQSDGKLLIGGTFTKYGSLSRNNIARLNVEDGSLDTTYKVGTGADNSVQTILVQNNGNSFIGGDFKMVNGKSKNYLASLNTNGSVDSLFATTYFNSSVMGSVLQKDGKIVINGFFTGEIARLSTDGSVDGSFYVGTGAGPSYLWTTSMQKDGKVFIGGYFTTYNGKPTNHIGRLTANGALDTSFHVGSGIGGYGQIRCSAIQNDGKILIGGDFTIYNGKSAIRLARLNTNGALDTTFKVGSQIPNNVTCLAIQNDGKIIVGGGFILRLNVDGTADNTFKYYGGNVTCQSIVLQNDGKILVGGVFSQYAGKNVNNIMRLHNTNGIVTGMETDNATQELGLSVYPNPNMGEFMVRSSKEESWSLVNSLGNATHVIDLNQGNNFAVNVSGLENGFYVLRSNSTSSKSHKVVVAK